MKLLLDTHIVLWALAEPHRIPAHARAEIENPANDVYVSAAATWEIAIKYASGKLRLPMAPQSYLPMRLHAHRFRELPISYQHTLVAAALPPHHQDPFDRLHVAQALVESLTLVTVDKRLSAYVVPIVDD